MKRMVIVFTTFLMFGVNLAAEVHMANKFPIEESTNQKNSIVRETPKVNSMEEKSKLVELAKKHFDDLSEAEIKFFTAIEKEDIADYTSSNKEENNPENADQWGNDRVLHAKTIKWLCTDPKAAKLVTHKGIQIKGARIEGELDLQFAEMGFPLVFLECVFDEMINVNSACIKFFILTGSYVDSIQADGVKIEGGVFLRDGFKADGELRFLGADIGQDFDCTDSNFTNKDGKAIIAERINVKGSVFLKNGFKANNEVCFLGAEIGGDFDCTNGIFVNKNSRAITADRVKVKGSIFLKDDFKANGEVRFLGAEIGGDFVCTNGEFINEGSGAVLADGMNVKGSVFLRNGFKANGEVRFLSTVIGRDFYCTNGEFINKSDKAISADGMDIKGCVYLSDSFTANGEVRFSGAKIGGDFDCENGKFVNEGNIAIKAEGIEIKGNVIFGNGFKAEGRVVFIGAIVDGHLIWSGVNLTEKTILDLRNAKVGILLDDKKSWPARGNLFLNGFDYEEIGDNSPEDAKSRIEWLRLNGGEEFSPQPYEQLAEVLRSSGREGDAKKILIEKNKDKSRLTKLTLSERLRHGLFGLTIAYGYKPWCALWWGLGIVLFGWLFFWAGYRADVMTPENEGPDTSGGFSALMYSLDVFVPIVDLRQASYRLPNANRAGKVRISDNLNITVSGKVLRYYFWFEIIAGWVLTTLLVVGVTGLVRT